jgi:hypothetical protein
MMKKHYAFLKNNRVVLVAVFESENKEIADLVKNDNNFDDYVWLGDSEVPHVHSTYDGKKFIEPTLDYLYEIGLSDVNQAMVDAKLAEMAEATDAEIK